MTDGSAASDPGDPVPALVPAGVPLMSQDFTTATVTALRHALQAQVAAAGLTGDTGYDFVLAAHELATNAVRHGGGHGHLDLHLQDDILICEITDQGPAAGGLLVRLPAVDVAGGRGLWLAQELTDGLSLTRRLDGVTATVTVCLQPTSGQETSQAPSALQNGEPSGPAGDNQR